MNEDAQAIAGSIIGTAFLMFVGVWHFTSESAGFVSKFAVCAGALVAAFYVFAWLFGMANWYATPFDDKRAENRRVSEELGLGKCPEKPFWPMKPVWFVLVPWFVLSFLFFSSGDRFFLPVVAFNLCLFTGATFATAFLPSARAYEVAGIRYNARWKHKKEIEKLWARYVEGRSAYTPFINHEIEEIHRAGGPEPSELEARLKNELEAFTDFLLAGNPIRFFRWKKQLEVIGTKDKPASKQKALEERLTPEQKLLRKAEQEEKERELQAGIERKQVRLEHERDEQMRFLLTEIQANRLASLAGARNLLLERGVAEEDVDEIIYRADAELERRKASERRKAKKA